MRILTNSAKNTFQLCDKRHYWRNEIGLVSKEPSFYLDVGTWFHEGVDHLLIHGLDESAVAEAKYDVIDPPENPERTDAFETARFMLERYAEFWRTKEPAWVETVETEQTIGFKFSDELALFGKLDGLVKDADGHTWIVEHKTTYKVDQEYLDKVKLDGQITFYMMLVREVFGFIPRGVIYNVTCRPRKYRRKNEPIKDYLKRCVEEYRSAPRSYMARNRAFRNPDDLELLEEELEYLSDRIQHNVEEDFWPRNTGVCYLRGRKCPYTDLCKGGPTPSILMRYEKDRPHTELDFESARTAHFSPEELECLA